MRVANRRRSDNIEDRRFETDKLNNVDFDASTAARRLGFKGEPSKRAGKYRDAFRIGEDRESLADTLERGMRMTTGIKGLFERPSHRRASNKPTSNADTAAEKANAKAIKQIAMRYQTGGSF